MNDYRWSPMPLGYGQWQPMPIQQKLPGISGRPVNTPQQIMPNEVPMDGTMSLFPKPDYSCIYGKIWNTDGTIRTVCFLPQVQEVKQQPADPQKEMIGYLKRIEEMQQLLMKELDLNAGLETNSNDDVKQKSKYNKQSSSEELP